MMHKDSFGYTMTLINAIFLFIVSLANFNLLNLDDSFRIFLYTLPFSICTCISNAILWHYLNDGRNERDGFTKVLKVSMVIIYIVAGLVILGFVAFLIRLLELHPNPSDPNPKALWFGLTTSGNLVSTNSQFTPWLSSFFYAVTQPVLYFFQVILGIIELVHFKRDNKSKRN